MIKISFLKLLNQTLVPAFVLIFAKITSFVLVASYLNQSFKFPEDMRAAFWFQNGLEELSDSFITANSASSLLTLLLTTVFFGWVVIKAHHFHDTHIYPPFAARLVKHGLEELVEDSFHLYHQGVVWLTLSWVFFFYSLVTTLVGITFWWLPAISFVVVFSLTMMLLEDILNEARRLKKLASN